MNAPLRHVAVACGLLFGLLLVNVTYLQAVRAEELRNRSGNARVLYEEYDRKRGPIVVEGSAVAHSKATEDELKYKRVYRSGPLYAHATGYYSLFSATAIENAKDDVLAGTDSRFVVRRLIDTVSGEETQGGSVVLTLDPDAQRAAFQGLRGKHGAAVAIDPQTGDILALTSSPSYDPNRLASHNAEKVRQVHGQLESSDAQPLLNRALSSTYPPGSTFKVITAAAALESGQYQPSTQIPSPHVLNLPRTTAQLRNFENEICSPTGRMSLANALKMSCNTAFAKLGLKLGSDELREQARKFGFGSTFEMPMESAGSVFPSSLNAPQTAQSAIGQYSVRATPLQMALVASAVANDGVMMEPHLVDEIKGPDLSTVDKAEPEVRDRALSSQVAGQLTQMMTLVVEQGTGTTAQLPGIRVAGKTGTAEHGTDAPEHAWFISFAPVENPQVAVAVVVENAGTTGGTVAAPIAQDIMKAVLSK